MSEGTDQATPAQPAAVRRARFPRAKPNLLEAGRRIGTPTLPSPQKAPAVVDVEIKNPPPIRRITRFTPVLGARAAAAGAKAETRVPKLASTPVAIEPSPTPDQVSSAPVEPQATEKAHSPILGKPESNVANIPSPERRKSSELDIPPTTPTVATLPSTEATAPAPVSSVSTLSESASSSSMMPPPMMLLPSMPSTSVAKSPLKSTIASTTSGGASDLSLTSSPVKQRKRTLSSRATETAEAIAKRRRYKKGTEPPEKSKMTMLDLIHWNPSKNPMTYEDNEFDVLEPLVDDRLAEEEVDDPVADEDDHMPVPRLKIGADGNIVVDEQSLVIENTNGKKDLSSSPAVYEHSSRTTYTSYRKKRVTRFWTDRETTRFYVALSAVGTDFSMMANLFPNRSRHELKTKFKKEDRVNKFLVDKVINDRQQYNLAIFDDNDELNLEVEEALATEKKRVKAENRARAKQKKIEAAATASSENPDEAKKPKSKRRVRLQEESDDSESELDESKLSDDITVDDRDETESQLAESVASDDDAAERASDEENDGAETCGAVIKPTRSGRQPKKKSTFTISITTPKRRGPRRPSARPASLTSPAPTAPEELDDAPQLVFFAENPTEGGAQKVHMLLVSPHVDAPITNPIDAAMFGGIPPMASPPRVSVPVTSTSPPTPDHCYSLATMSAVVDESLPSQEQRRTQDSDSPSSVIPLS